VTLVRLIALSLFLGLGFSACANVATNESAIHTSVGVDPYLPAPTHSLIPTIHVARARGWPPDTAPVVAAGLAVNIFAMDLAHPRWLYALPNGDMLVAETNAPPRTDDTRGVKGFVMRLLKRRAGGGVVSANDIVLLRDHDGDGVAETRSILLQDLNSPFGMALVGDALYVANTDAVVRFPYQSGDTRITAAGVKVADLPAGTINHHWTKNIVASANGALLYISVGSNSNAAENGLNNEKGRAAVWELNIASGKLRLFASGLRNPVGMAWQPASGALWVAVNERDELGNDLVPDYMTTVRDGGFYGWPYSYFGQHGSWNRRPRSGYKLVFVPFANGVPSGAPEEILTGFVNDKGEARGRPVGVAIDKRGAVLLADDVGNRVWRVVPAGN
jgi:glucose/arabinose dehydrogenase